MSFKSLNINPKIIRALNNEGIVDPTEIQQKTIPLISDGKDVIGISHTGSGKTAAFAIPILEKIQKGKGIQALVVVPTRELACQISQEFEKFGKNLSYSIETIYGGVAIGPQINRLPKADIVVCTPGRLLDHINRKTINLSKVRNLVLDEADIMVDMGFFDDIKKILNAVPKNRQISLFGATISDEINELKKKYMNKPIVEKSEAHVNSTLLKQYYYKVAQKEKFSLLVHLLKNEATDRVIVFCPTRSKVESVSKNLKMNGIKSNMIHGKIKQSRRLKVIDNFNKGRPKVLVASGVASRGLDIKGVSHVYNYGLSQDPQEYIHRIGRTARAGEAGKAITLLSPVDNKIFTRIINMYDIDVENIKCKDFSKIHFDSRENSGDTRRRNEESKNTRNSNQKSKRKLNKPSNSRVSVKVTSGRKSRVKYRTKSQDGILNETKKSPNPKKVISAI